MLVRLYGACRFTRLTNGFSKKVENHAAMVSLHFMYYNFARVHQTHRVRPAMQAGIATHVWSIKENRRLARLIRHGQTERCTALISSLQRDAALLPSAGLLR